MVVACGNDRNRKRGPQVQDNGESARQIPNGTNSAGGSEQCTGASQICQAWYTVDNNDVITMYLEVPAASTGKYRIELCDSFGCFTEPMYHLSCAGAQDTTCTDEEPSSTGLNWPVTFSNVRKTIKVGPEFWVSPVTGEYFRAKSDNQGGQYIRFVQK